MPSTQREIRPTFNPHEILVSNPQTLNNALEIIETGRQTGQIDFTDSLLRQLTSFRPNTLKSFSVETRLAIVFETLAVTGWDDIRNLKTNGKFPTFTPRDMGILSEAASLSSLFWTQRYPKQSPGQNWVDGVSKQIVGCAVYVPDHAFEFAINLRSLAQTTEGTVEPLLNNTMNPASRSQFQECTRNAGIFNTTLNSSSVGMSTFAGKELIFPSSHEVYEEAGVIWTLCNVIYEIARQHINLSSPRMQYEIFNAMQKQHQKRK